MSKIVIGKKLPTFTAISTENASLHSKDLVGKNLVMYFYPKDNTPGCTTESIGFAEAYQKFKRQKTEIIGISRDSIASHERFIEKYQLPFQLISDKDEKLCFLFDVIKEKKLYGKTVLGIERSTFLFDAEGVLRHEWRKVKVPGHVDEVLQSVKAL